MIPFANKRDLNALFRHHDLPLPIARSFTKKNVNGDSSVSLPMGCKLIIGQCLKDGSVTGKLLSKWYGPPKAYCCNVKRNKIVGKHMHGNAGRPRVATDKVIGTVVDKLNQFTSYQARVNVAEGIMLNTINEKRREINKKNFTMMSRTVVKD